MVVQDVGQKQEMRAEGQTSSKAQERSKLGG